LPLGSSLFSDMVRTCKFKRGQSSIQKGPPGIKRGQYRPVHGNKSTIGTIAEHRADQSECSLWVISCRNAGKLQCPLFTQKRLRQSPTSAAAKGQNRTPLYSWLRHRLKLSRPPRLVEPRVERTVEAQEGVPPLAGDAPRRFASRRYKKLQRPSPPSSRGPTRRAHPKPTSRRQAGVPRCLRWACLHPSARST
jgi:hypothetical protein